jgi:hypothetical protein
MQSEEFDTKVREAAAHHHPVYNENAWGDMEKLLDKHLPQEKEKKRRFLFWFLLPLLLVGTGLLIAKPWQKSNHTIAENTLTEKSNKSNTTVKEEKNTPGIQSPPSADKIAAGSGDNTKAVPVDAAVSTQKGTSDASLTTPATAQSIKQKRETQTSPTTTTTGTKKPQDILAKESRAVRKELTASSPVAKAKSSKDRQVKDTPFRKQQIVPVAKNQPVDQQNEYNVTVDKNAVERTDHVGSVTISDADDKKNELTTKSDVTSTLVSAETVAKDIPKAVSAVKEDSVANVIAKSNKQPDSITAKTAAIKKNKATNTFFAGVSFGGDISFVGGNKIGTTKTVTGIGVGYTIKNKLTIRTGFYSGRKIYSADADSYNPPPAFTQYYPYLEKVDANCKVYEIPVALSWHFGKNPSANWFVSAGLSSLLMKKETYNYFYKYTPTGATYSNEWTIKDENKHYFSVATISAGYQRSIGKRMIFIAEPYVKMPLGGVGFGKVRLNSTGVLFTVGIKPF